MTVVRPKKIIWPIVGILAYVLAPQVCLSVCPCSFWKEVCVLCMKSSCSCIESVLLQKLLAIIGGTKIEMMPAETVTSQYQSTADMVILVNGRPVSGSRSVGQLMLDQGVEITMESSEESMAPYYRISAPQLGVEVWFDGHNAALKVSGDVCMGTASWMAISDAISMFYGKMWSRKN